MLHEKIGCPEVFLNWPIHPEIIYWEIVRSVDQMVSRYSNGLQMQVLHGFSGYGIYFPFVLVCGGGDISVDILGIFLMFSWLRISSHTLTRGIRLMVFRPSCNLYAWSFLGPYGSRGMEGIRPYMKARIFVWGSNSKAVGTFSDPTETNATDFIRTSCATTLYPELCYSSLSRYANAVQNNPAQLARIAIAISLSKARQITSYVNNLTREADYGANSRAASALHDCFSTLGDAVDEMRGSIKQMNQLAAAGTGAGSFRFQMSNVQTWMSAALTDEETCTDGFEDVSDGPLKTDVCDRVTNVKKFTSNALALVNSCAAKGTP
ncbi:21 kDa protein-like [Quillaja saponaria]|uniref:21 kDa protein-like n=1 Tax=Quillaja saponaria TaxID=32244 RepID=A0AAD7LAL4_QUISA|nr:21 kDa protein-like [Quillaja saponaria]